MMNNNAPKTNNCRALAACTIAEVIYDGRSLTECLTQYQKSCEPSQIALYKALCFGVMRHLLRLQFFKAQLLQKPLAAKESRVDALILLGLYQILETRVVNHAAVNETLRAAEALKKPWAKGLLNGVLRNFLRQKQSLQDKVKEHPEAATLHPSWLIARLQQAYPEHYQQIMINSNTQAPMTLRVNKAQITQDNYLALLQEASITGQITAFSQLGITLSHAVPTSTLPGFDSGMVSVQDQSGQMVVSELALSTPARVLDACSAPGSKLCQLLETYPELTVTAIDKSASRLNLIKENLQRLKLPQPQLIAADASELTSWWDNEEYDAILLDAPCSATGVIRRHPDIKWLRQEEDIENLQQIQLSLLQQLWRTLKQGGELIYSTCSILPDENDQVIEHFLVTEKTAAVTTRTDVEYGHATRFGRQTLPGDDDMDGFYYAKLVKR